MIDVLPYIDRVPMTRYQADSLIRTIHADGWITTDDMIRAIASINGAHERSEGAEQ